MSSPTLHGSKSQRGRGLNILPENPSMEKGFRVQGLGFRV